MPKRSSNSDIASPTGPPPAMNTDVWRVASAARPMRVSPWLSLARRVRRFLYLTRICLIWLLSRLEMEANNMDLRQLRYFIAVAERGGFAAAASTLNVAQSALSRHVKELEHELGGKLFERGARGVSVTESGKVLLARGRWLLGTIDDIKAEVRTENREPSGTVRLGAPSSLAEILYAPFAQVFVKRFPRVRLELSEGLTE